MTQTNEVRRLAGAIRQNIESVIIGKAREIELILTALLAGGHVLLEDVPGTGKTALAKALAQSIGCTFNRVQFTPDLLPSDLTGVNFFNPQTGTFTFRRGALFTHILLADELNRATPRTQSGLLESMEERQITTDGETYPLHAPFFVIATQNPVETLGTYPLPEAQLDRFMLRLPLGYPTAEESAAILRRFGTAEPAAPLAPVCDGETLLAAARVTRTVYIHDELLAYIVALAERTRIHESVTLGVSTRGNLMLMHSCKAYAAIQGRGFVIPDDIQTLLPYVFGHRIVTRTRFGGETGQNDASLLETILADVAVPAEDWAP